MQRRKIASMAGGALALSMVLAACGNGGTAPVEVAPGGTAEGPAVVDGGGTAAGDNRQHITWAGWDPRTGLEFISLSEGFNAYSDQCVIDVVDYMTTGEYRVALTADLAAGSAPDVLTLIDVPHFVTLSQGGQLLDIDDVVAAADPSTQSINLYQGTDGHFQAVPIRQDFWVLYYNRDLFEQAGVVAIHVTASFCPWVGVA